MNDFTESSIDDELTERIVMEIARRLTGGTADTQQAAEAALKADGFEGMTIDGSDE
jgi:hypothetical protein